MKGKTAKTELSDKVEDKELEELNQLCRLTDILNNRDRNKPLYIRKKSVYGYMSNKRVCIMSSEEFDEYTRLYAKYNHSVTKRGGFKKGKIKTIPPVDERYKGCVRNNGRINFY